MKMVMLKWPLFCLALICRIFLAACTPSAAFSQTPAATPGAIRSPTLPPSFIPVTTEFGKMLSTMPYSFLKEHDIWFGNPGQVWQLHEIAGVHSYTELNNLSPENRNALLSAQVGIVGNTTHWRTLDIASLIGFDGWMVDRALLTETPPRGSFSVNEGNFDESLIKSRLVEQGYTRVEQGAYSYYSLNSDDGFEFGSDLGKLGVLDNLNRIDVLDNTIVTASNTGAMNDLLNVLSGKESSVMDSAAGQALVASLGDVISGVIMDPARVINQDPSQAIDPFYFAVPADWASLHSYDMVGMGYKYDGHQSAWIISLFYKDGTAASSDADVLVNRMKSYVFATQIKGAPKRDFTFYGFSIGKPVIQQYFGGATLTVECAGNPWPLSRIEMRDLLFLVPDPSECVAK